MNDNVVLSAVDRLMPIVRVRPVDTSAAPRLPLGVMSPEGSLQPDVSFADLT